jgi:hypothetical protein
MTKVTSIARSFSPGDTSPLRQRFGPGLILQHQVGSKRKEAGKRKQVRPQKHAPKNPRAFILSAGLDQKDPFNDFITFQTGLAAQHQKGGWV